MPPKLGAKALAKKKANAKAAEKAKAKFEAEQKAAAGAAKAKAQAKAGGGDAAASSLLFQDQDPLPPAFSRIFCIPRDASRVLQIECIEDEKNPEVKYVGPDYGKAEGKYISALPAISNDNYYCIPYASQRVLEIDPKESIVKAFGDRLLPGCGKYTDAIASQDYRLKLYAAPCRSRRVLQIDPVTGEVKEVGKELGDPNEVKEIVVRGMTMDSSKANGIYVKADDRFDKFPYFRRTSALPKNDYDEANANEPPVESDDDFDDFVQLEFYIYCIKRKRWCLGPELGAEFDKAWCWKRGKEEAPPGGMWNHNLVPLEELGEAERRRRETKMKKEAAEKEAAEKAAAKKKAAEDEARRAEQQRLLASQYGEQVSIEKQRAKAKDINQAGATVVAKVVDGMPPATQDTPEEAAEEKEGEDEAEGDDAAQAEESSSEEDFGPMREDSTRCTGHPNLEVRHPPKWWACAYSPHKNRIYAVPYNARRVLRINPAKDGEAEECGPDLGPMHAKYSSIALAPNGCLFAAPLNAPRVLMISEEGVVSLVGPDFGKQERKYSCMVLGRNKLIYSPPLYADRVLEINIARGESRQIGPILGMGEAKYCCGGLHRNGNIYCPPLEARRVIEIRCEDHEVEEFGMDLGGAEHEKYSSCAASVVGNMLYAAPREAHKVIEIDPARYFIREVGPELGRIPRKFTCMLAGPRVQPPRPPPEEDELDKIEKAPAEPEEAVPVQPVEAPPPQEAPPPPQQPSEPQQPPPRSRPQQSPEQFPEQNLVNPLQRKPQLY